MATNLIQVKRTSSLSAPIPPLLPGELVALISPLRGHLYLGLDDNTAIRIGSGTPAYTHEQAVASLTWIVDHDLGYQPIIEVRDTTGEVIEAAVDHGVSLVQSIITFTVLTAGVAYCSADFLGNNSGGTTPTAWGGILGNIGDQVDLTLALAGKVSAASPALTGVPTAPTAPNGTNTTQIATTAFVLANAGSVGDGVYGGITVSSAGTVWTVNTNANLTGPVTSIGNATSIPNGAITNAMLANSAVALLSNTNTGDDAVNALYSSLVSNATHTGDVTGSTVLTLATVTQGVLGTNFVKIGLDTKGRVTNNVAVTESDITGVLGPASITNLMLVSPTYHGSATVDFTATPSQMATVSVTAQTQILTTSRPRAWFVARSTVDNGVDQHIQAAIECTIVCTEPVAGVGFDIKVYCLHGLAKGQFLLEWQWN
jgi:hypothetical protein